MEYLRGVLRKAICTALQDLDNLLVLGGVLCKADLQLPKKSTTLLKSLLLLKLPNRRKMRKNQYAAGSELEGPEKN